MEYWCILYVYGVYRYKVVHVVNSKHFSFVLSVSVGGQISEYSNYLSYVAKIGYIEWNHEYKSLTYCNLTLSKENMGCSIYSPSK